MTRPAPPVTARRCELQACAATHIRTERARMCRTGADRRIAELWRRSEAWSPGDDGTRCMGPAQPPLATASRRHAVRRVPRNCWGAAVPIRSCACAACLAFAAHCCAATNSAWCRHRSRGRCRRLRRTLAAVAQTRVARVVIRRCRSTPTCRCACCRLRRTLAAVAQMRVARVIIRRCRSTPTRRCACCQDANQRSARRPRRWRTRCSASTLTPCSDAAQRACGQGEARRGKER